MSVYDIFYEFCNDGIKMEFWAEPPKKLHLALEAFGIDQEKFIKMVEGMKERNPSIHTIHIEVPLYLAGLEQEEKENKMTLDIKKYDRKPFSVDAVQVTGENLGEVAAWCHGTVQDAFSGRAYIKVNVKHPLSQRQTKAYVGDWVLSSNRGYKVYTDAAINHAFVQREEDAPQELFTTDEPVDDTRTLPQHEDPKFQVLHDMREGRGYTNVFEDGLHKQSDYRLIGNQQDVHDAIRGKR